MIMIVILCCEKGSDIVITPIKPSLLNVFGVQMSKPPSLGKLKRIKEAQRTVVKVIEKVFSYGFFLVVHFNLEQNNCVRAHSVIPA